MIQVRKLKLVVAAAVAHQAKQQFTPLRPHGRNPLELNTSSPKSFRLAGAEAVDESEQQAPCAAVAAVAELVGISW
jgi:hypothetical protein